MCYEFRLRHILRSTSAGTYLFQATSTSCRLYCFGKGGHLSYDWNTILVMVDVTGYLTHIRRVWVKQTHCCDIEVLKCTINSEGPRRINLEKDYFITNSGSWAIYVRGAPRRSGIWYRPRLGWQKITHTDPSYPGQWKKASPWGRALDVHHVTTTCI